MEKMTAYVGLDVHKDTIAVAVAEAERNGEVRSWGTIANTPTSVDKLLNKLRGKYAELEFAHEAGPTGYGLYRTLHAKGAKCIVVAPSMTPKKPSDRIKNDTRDASMLARLLRAGELTAVWVPDEVHEAMRDLARARQTASYDVRKARQRIQSFLLRQGRQFGAKSWTYRHRVWLSDQSFDHIAQQIAFQSYLNAHEQAESRRKELDEQIVELIPHWSLAPIVEALQALKGIGVVVAVALVAEIGDFMRFANPRQLMAYLGLVPGERSSGKSLRPRGITKSGNITLRSLLFEAAWCYRNRPKVGQWCWTRMPETQQVIKDIAWKAQVRLHGRYRKLISNGKRSQVAVTAVARELLGFIWAVCQHVQPSELKPDLEK
ncbi:IS110 family transposase [Agrobacterium tumefaciens]|jgi:transposase|uniref:IS110 family transposase n=1 Tax=Agrobacterium tumefaciens TaxID=358 RepID=A0AA44F1R8_AGRTU|nr:IS110 family transposase [Agrobacterium tumefaciens]NSL24033.1 IS110 family transposase [Agrobacterium tumefaciens]NTB87996.1 IS110 family transposase [Agrobacterium tumefaciens]NTC16240.1 IS110 family transposase [Agrobacterium tumefaciens]NTC27812.1 IS110 family transposase [Agrobacterium tumefaciens]NTC55642.1 IS110 family transposase [Agrobacterium tumefaciens]